MIDKLIYFIKERESIRIKKEGGDPKPWTDDPILRGYRFCNVRREDDKVSRWIHANWIWPNLYQPNLLPAILLSRLINWPETLEEIGFPDVWEPQEYARRIRARMERGDKTWTGAYMITAEHDGTPKEISVCKTVTACGKAKWRFDTCLDVWMDLQNLPRIGSFMAAQIIADLKHTPLLALANDSWSFCAPGPGSQKGLNLILNTPHKEWKQPEFRAEIIKLQDILPIELDAHNVQNCLCEFSKYIRGSSRSGYNGY